MTILSYSTKRRRLNDGASALSKPFKSPLKAATRPFEDGERDGEKAVDTNNGQEQKKDLTATIHSSHLDAHPTTASTGKSTPTDPSTDHLKEDSILHVLEKQHSDLIFQLNRLGQNLDTAQQALKIASSSADTELENVITKWKLASREAAEEVFRGAKDRVNGMGGVGAWRERSRKKPEGWDDENLQADLRYMSEEQREEMEMRKDEWETERRKYGSEKEEEVMENEDDSFTMDMMLESLNIELDVIGYDKNNQRWCD
ncbi:hypothetical protein EPUS_02393 [Endocarpon pusillum Z07020]|uniref:DNA repair protein Dds20/Mei5 n=1 Tax=Endocarpon pusillum (strain Z07020 / HMAS-L-300199) TaxID=1263415 RepID=U1GGG7_ENDPU|nr:uncharacterized protein EPUS_02393 [Endocarpon pusillum Z07020]ERF70871.1 hypothetical protein EPUS_02393 [Endocarpon pusillum Z07020]